LGTLEFDVGEIKYVTAIIRTKNENDIIIINEATWELLDAPEHPIDSGHCLVSGDEVTALIETSKKGNYILKFKVKIGPEVIIEKIAIRVN
jgi:hypothetical protein